MSFKISSGSPIHWNCERATLLRRFWKQKAQVFRCHTVKNINWKKYKKLSLSETTREEVWWTTKTRFERCLYKNSYCFKKIQHACSNIYCYITHTISIGSTRRKLVGWTGGLRLWPKKSITKGESTKLKRMGNITTPSTATSKQNMIANHGTFGLSTVCA